MSMKWKQPIKRYGLYSIKSICGEWLIKKRFIAEIAEYILLKLSGSIWKRLGVYPSADEAKEAVEQ